MKYFILQFLIFCCLLDLNIVAGADQACGFVGLDANRPDDPYFLNPISDLGKDRQNLLTLKTYGTELTGRINDAEGHYDYLGAAFAISGQTYYVRGNGRTKDFTREKKIRMIKRQIRLYSTSVKDIFYDYYFEIPILDMTPPEFDSVEYTFNIGEDWDRTLPISEGKIIIVSDNAYEISEINPDLLQFASVPAGSLRIEKFPLWVFPYPERYFYRLDIYIEDDVVLEPEKQLRYTLSAKDEYNTGAADIVINISKAETI